VLDILATPWRGYVPLPRPQFHFWNSNVLDGVTNGEILQAVLGIGLLIVLGSLFVRCAPVLLLYVMGSAGLVLFSLLIYSGFLRHHGHHLLLLMAALWLARVIGLNDAGRDGEPSGSGGALRWRAALVSVLLVLNMVAGVYAVSREWRDPFSASREVAEYIRAQGLAGLPIVGHRDFQAATVAGYLERPIYYPSLGREASFIPWLVNWGRVVDDAETVRQARVLAAERRSEVLIVFSRSGPRRPERIGGATRIRGFPRSIERSERFELYRVLPADSADAQ
jgi:hypothetical protein